MRSSDSVIHDTGMDQESRFITIFERYANDIFSHSLSFGIDRTRAFEITRETFTRTWRKRERRHRAIEAMDLFETLQNLLERERNTIINAISLERYLKA